MTPCPSCGRQNEPHYKFCLGCGHELPPVSAAQRAMPAPTTDGWLEDETLGSKVSTTVEVAPDLLPAPTRTCATCGNQVPPSFTFCGQCGARMDAPAPARAATSGASQGTLVLVRADGSEGGSFALHARENVIGRGSGPLFDSDGYLSPRHALIELGASGATVTDTGSLNGVFVRLTEEEELFDGDVFRVGQELLRFDLLPPAEPLADGTHIMGSPPGGAWGRLVLIVSREQDGSAFPLSGESVILGRERGDILFPEDGYVSGLHCQISLQGGRLFLTDLGSSNGTFVRIYDEVEVSTGDVLLMGQQLFRVTL